MIRNTNTQDNDETPKSTRQQIEKVNDNDSVVHTPTPTREPFMNGSWIDVYGARVHNLKNIDVSIPRGSLTVITGLSGSGKSSLAFDTIFAEGQRRYIETFSAYARNFLGNMERPDVDKITCLLYTSPSPRD